MIAARPYQSGFRRGSVRDVVLGRLARAAAPLDTLTLARRFRRVRHAREQVYGILAWEWSHGRVERLPPLPVERRRNGRRFGGRRAFRWALTPDGLRAYLQARGPGRKEVRG